MKRASLDRKIYLGLTDPVSSRKYYGIVAELKDLQKLKSTDDRFFQIALNLSGNRDQLEKDACELIAKHGSPLKALVESRQLPITAEYAAALKNLINNYCDNYRMDDEHKEQLFESIERLNSHS